MAVKKNWRVRDRAPRGIFKKAPMAVRAANRAARIRERVLLCIRVAPIVNHFLYRVYNSIAQPSPVVNYFLIFVDSLWPSAIIKGY
jgi:hypothetical protein